ncbi:MAG: HPr family phosphocarrier protein [Clostridia bacterium]|nr:HPr family phosphocarrier protein [Clostridia bacterium]
MKEFKYVVTDPEGIHARPAGEFVKAASKFSSDVKLTKDGKTVSAKKIFGVMGLAVKQGQELTITIEGPDEDTASAELEEFLKNNL